MRLAAHELLEPLVLAETYITLVHARIDSKTSDDSGEKLAAASRALARARIVVEAVMVDAVDPGFEFVKRPVDLQQLTDDALRLLEPERTARDATIRTGFLPTVRGDEALLGAVLRNLLLNAIRHGRPHGTVVDISAERRGDTWRLAVASDGPVIPEEDRATLFRPQERPLKDKAPHRGGLGLLICARLVARHGGQIGVELGPENENVFVVTLPV